VPRLKYKTNSGKVGYTIVRPGFDGPEQYGVEPSEAADSSLYFYKSGSRRRKGTQVRYLICSRNDGGLTPGGQQPKKYAFVTVGDPVIFRDAYVEGQEVNLPGGVYILDFKKDEG